MRIVHKILELVSSRQHLTNFYFHVCTCFLLLCATQIRCFSILNHTIEPSVASYCSSVTLTCRVDAGAPDVDVWWVFRGENASQLPNTAIIANNSNEGVWQLGLKCPTLEYNGTYTCNALVRNESEVVYRKVASLRIYVPVTIQLNHSITRQRLGGKVNLTCLVNGYPLPVVKWYKDSQLLNTNSSSFYTYVGHADSASLLASLHIDNLMPDNNGTYICQAINTFSNATALQDLFVEEPPVVEFMENETVVENPGTAILRWHVRFDGNSPIERFHLDRNSSDLMNSSIVAVDHDIRGNISKYIIHNLQPGTAYRFRLSAVNSAGHSAYDYVNISIPAHVPSKVPQVHLLNSVSEKLILGWVRASRDNGANITCYGIKLQYKNGSITVKDEIEVKEPEKNNYIYTFDILDPGETYIFQVQACNVIGCGLWSEPLEVTTSDGISDPPRNVVVTCAHDFIEEKDTLTVTWEAPLHVHGTILSYNLTIYSTFRYHNENGQIVEGSKTDIVDVNLNSTEYKTAVLPNTEYTVRMCTINKNGCGSMTKISENVQCKSDTNVPSNLPEFTLKKKNASNAYNLLEVTLQRVNERNGSILSYKIIIIKLARGKNMSDLPDNPNTCKMNTCGNAYIAEAFKSGDFVSEVIIGDNRQQNSCYSYQMFEEQTNGTQYFEEKIGMLKFEDRPLEPSTNYTGYILIEVLGPNDTILIKTSPYFLPVLTDDLPIPPYAENPVFIALKVFCSLAVSITFFSVIVLRIRHSYGPEYFETLRNPGLAALGLRCIDRCGIPSRIRRIIRVPRFRSIPAKKLPASFNDRHEERNLLFQIEFKALPENFKDRTTSASDAPENLNKNRYDDIKAYDQTRVKLPEIKGVPGSDYINANIVKGYKERKMYICAQSPLENTVIDFWRMIWKYRVTVVVMLTNIEEHGQVKCAQYWYDSCPAEIEKMFLVTVKSIHRYSDYIVRKFQVINKSDELKEVREVLHFQYISWKDLFAPEQPSWLLRFIKIVNENYCTDRGPLLVHCSSGVGRTGAFVAIDILSKQLEKETKVSVFKYVSNFRIQRNYFVQSLKQYIFVYRALTEHYLFGDTEIDVEHLEEHYESLKNGNDTDKSGIDNEFEKLRIMDEDPKICNEGNMKINAKKNRYNFIIPYDFNRVILLPLSSNHNSTYINASFIRGYDRTSLFIVTQDPLESTVFDFWRMIKEKRIISLVMLSEMGKGHCKCQRYWPTSEKSELCGNIIVTLENSENFPFYIKRQFALMDANSGDKHTVTQFQLRKWPLGGETTIGSTIGLVTLIEDVHRNQERQIESGPITVHCSGGGDRSSAFVTLSSLLIQLKMGQKVDVVQSVKFARLQRQCMIHSLALYDLLYRGLLEYIISRNICDVGDTAL